MANISANNLGVEERKWICHSVDHHGYGLHAIIRSVHKLDPIYWVFEPVGITFGFLLKDESSMD